MFLGEKVLEEREKNAANLQLPSLDKKCQKKADVHKFKFTKVNLKGTLASTKQNESHPPPQKKTVL